MFLYTLFLTIAEVAAMTLMAWDTIITFGDEARIFDLNLVRQA